MRENSQKADWQNLHYFHFLAREGSFSAAARMLGVEHATIARRIASLESETKLKLIDRRGRRIVLTPDGQRVAAIAARMEGEVLGVERLKAADSGLEAHVKISAPPDYACHVLVARLARLKAANAGLRLTLLGETRYVSLDRREADIAIRLDRPQKGDLAIRKIGEIAFRLYAREDYLTAHSQSEWDYIAYGDEMAGAPNQRWLRDLAGEKGFAVQASTLEMQAKLASLGAGVAFLPDFVVSERSGLVPVRPETAMKRDVWLAVHNDVKGTPAIRVVIDALASN